MLKDYLVICLVWSDGQFYITCTLNAYPFELEKTRGNTVEGVAARHY